MLFTALRLVSSASVAPAEDAQGEEALVARAVGGDRAAADALVRRHAASLLGLVLRLVGRRQDAEDIVQDAFAVAMSELSALRDRSAFGPWLRSIAVRQAHRYFRRRKLLRTFGLDRGVDDATLAAMASSQVSQEVRVQLAALDAVLAQLPYEHRLAWSLRYVEGDSLEDIAAACGCSLATVKRWIAAAHARVTERVSLAGEERS
jgi:RNA polymerase sigma-70 factor (ECF subfamily)